MLKAIYPVGLYLALCGVCAVVSDSYGIEEFLVESFPVEPNRHYLLTLETAAGQSATHASWLLRIYNRDGDLPFDGHIEREWQRFRDTGGRHIHAFLAPPDADTLRVKVRSQSGDPRLIAVEMEEINPVVGLPNHDFSFGVGNFSGWTDHAAVEWVEVNGDTALRVNQNGYLLSDYIPVRAGGGYDLAGGWPRVSVLAYDIHRRFIDRVDYERGGDPPMIMPHDAAFVRLLFNTGHDHIEIYRTNTVRGRGLQALEYPVGEVAIMPAYDFSEGEIILSPASDPIEVHAARELQYWIRRISGINLPVLAQASDRSNRKFHIGGDFAGHFEDDLTYLGDSDGYAVRKQGDNYYIFGTRSRGTLFGVYAFLERNSDIIWPRPQPGLDAVYTRQTEMDFKDHDFRSRPVFKYRHISRGGYGVMRRNSHVFQDWKARNGVNTGHGLHMGFNYLLWVRGARPGYSGGYIGQWIGDEKDDDERFYPLIDGRREITFWRQPCFTYEETPRAIERTIRERIAILPDSRMEYLEARLADNWSVCACDDCMSPILLDDGTMLEARATVATDDPLFFSTRHFKMLNQVAESLAEDFPDLTLFTHAYIFTAEPPAVEVHPAIVPQFAAYPVQNLRFPISAGMGRDVSIYDKDTWSRRFSEWGRRDNRLGFFGYYYTPGFNAAADSAAVDYRDLAGFGGVHVHTEGYPVDDEALSMWDADGIEKWVIARLQWDPYQDPEALRANYIQRVYREAAPEMTRFYQRIRESWHGPDEDVFVNCHSTPQFMFQTFIVEPGLEEELGELLEQAVQAVEHPVAKKIVQRTQAQFKALGDTLGRHFIPYVEESTIEWKDPLSIHWEKAIVFDDFKKVDDWRVFEQAAADNPTDISMMRDHEHLYVRAVSHNKGHRGLDYVQPVDSRSLAPQDIVELILGDGHREVYFSFGPRGESHTRYHTRDGRSPILDLPLEVHADTHGQGWVVVASIPLDAFEFEDRESPRFLARMGRLYQPRNEAREESSLSGRGIFNRHDTFWTQLQID